MLANEHHPGFLVTSLSRLAKETGASAVVLGEYLDQPLSHVRTLCFLHHGERLDNFGYPVKGDPAETLLKREALSLSDSAQERYPKSLLLRDFHVQACAAIATVFANDGQKGIVALFWETPNPEADRTLGALRSFAATFEQEYSVPLLDIERERKKYAAFVHEEFFREYTLDSPEAIAFSEYMPPVPLDLPHDELLERLMHSAHVIQCNPAMANLYDFPDIPSFLGATPFECNGPERAPRLVEYWMERQFNVCDLESQLVDAEGNIAWVLGTARGRIAHNRLTHILTKRSDITARKRYEAAIQHRAHHDSLTELPNRFWFQEYIAGLIESHGTRGKQFCIGLLDLNGFKEINDTLGHAIGDQVLQAVAKRLLKGLKSHDAQVARLGGDEFAIVLPDVRHPERIEAMTKKVQHLLKEGFVVENLQLSIGGSLGLALFPEHSRLSDDLLRMADVAMYVAKGEGLTACWYRPELDRHSKRRLSLLAALAPAIDQGELFLVFQPIIDLWNGHLSSFEALVRWRHPEHGLILPGDFIPFAETSEVIRPLTRWVLTNAIRQAAEWRRQGRDLTVSVNISARNLLDEDLGRHIAECLAEHDLPAKALELEVTESALMTRQAQALQILNALRATGLSIAIDDFGTGYSSLAYLARLPVNTLKVDQTFVRGMHDSRTNEQIVRSVIGLAHECQLSVVAEGVEDEATFMSLYNMGCDLMQGYLVARPMEADAATEWMRTNLPFKIRE